MKPIKKNFTTIDFTIDATFPIGGWVEPLPPTYTENQNMITEESYRKIKACGFDFVCCIYSSYPKESEQVLEHLDAAEKAGVGLFISDTDAQKGDITIEDEYLASVRKNHEEYSCKKSFLGWLVKDEPGSKMFPELIKRTALLKQVDAQAEQYINLLPTYSTGFMLENGYWGNNAPVEKCDPIAYEKYVADFVEQVQPQFLCYDFYPFDDGETGVSVLPVFFLQLSIAMRNAAEAQIPFIPFVQACKFNKWSRVPTEEEMRWQINTTLAYGAKGLQYFTLWSPVDSAYENFSGCILGVYGEMGVRYELVQRFNQWTKKVGQYLLNLSLAGLIYNGFSPAEIPESDVLEDPKIALTGDALLGVFEDGLGKQWAYLVCNKIQGKSVITLKIDGANSLTVISESGEKRLENDCFAAELEAGAGVLIQIH